VHPSKKYVKPLGISLDQIYIITIAEGTCKHLMVVAQKEVFTPFEDSFDNRPKMG
jgi:hypothetical protein